MNITKEQLDNLVIPTNYVIVRPVVNNKTVLIGNTNIDIDISILPGKHMDTICEVVKVCKELRPTQSDFSYDENGVMYDCDIDLQEGDLALCYFRTLHNAIMGVQERHELWYNGRRINVDGKTHVAMKYDEIYCAKRGDQIITVNGWNIIELRRKQFADFGITLPESAYGGKSDYYGVIKHPAKPIMHHEEEDASEGFSALSEGDIVMMDHRMVIETESELHVQFFEEEMFRLQQKDILMVLDEQLTENV